MTAVAGATIVVGEHGRIPHQRCAPSLASRRIPASISPG